MRHLFLKHATYHHCPDNNGCRRMCFKLCIEHGWRVSYVMNDDNFFLN